MEDEISLRDLIPGDTWEFNKELFEIMEISQRKDGCFVLVVGEVGQETEDPLEPMEIGEDLISDFEAIEVPDGKLVLNREIRTQFP